jgi:hypothetical protein
LSFSVESRTVVSVACGLLARHPVVVFPQSSAEDNRTDSSVSNMVEKHFDCNVVGSNSSDEIEHGLTPKTRL